MIWRSTSILFAENQLSLSLIGLSPLPTRHPRILQHTWVRSSSLTYQTFNLRMGRSLSFGSHDRNLFAQLRLAFALPPHICLSLLQPCTRWLIMQKERLCTSYFRLIVIHRISKSFHSLFQGSFHLSLTVLVRYRIQESMFSRGWSPYISHRMRPVVHTWYAGIVVLGFHQCCTLFQVFSDTAFSAFARHY